MREGERPAGFVPQAPADLPPSRNTLTFPRSMGVGRARSSAAAKDSEHGERAEPVGRLSYEARRALPSHHAERELSFTAVIRC